MPGQTPITKMPTLIVLLAFKPGENGDLQPAFEPREMQSEERAIREAKIMAGSGQFAGVIAWSREARPDIGEYGEPEILFQDGDAPTME